MQNLVVNASFVSNKMLTCQFVFQHMKPDPATDWTEKKLSEKATGEFKSPQFIPSAKAEDVLQNRHATIPDRFPDNARFIKSNCYRHSD